MLLYEMINLKQICISMVIASFNVTTADETAVRTEVLDLKILTLSERKVVRKEEIDYD